MLFLLPITTKQTNVDSYNFLKLLSLSNLNCPSPHNLPNFTPFGIHSILYIIIIRFGDTLTEKLITIKYEKYENSQVILVLHHLSRKDPSVDASETGWRGSTNRNSAGIRAPNASALSF